WAKDLLHWTFEEWSRTVFSDETYFTTIGFNYHPMVIQNSEEEFHLDCIDECEKSDRSVEDEAPSHNKYTIKCREKNMVDKILDWPPQSSHLNLIENIWGWIQCELGETWGRIKELEPLKVVVRIVWDSIPVDFLEVLIRSMPAQLQAVITTDGGATMY
ncbi:hypothetical protein L873DRAFT_1665396, partial [Choiromyces venosus 120613-1]